MFFEGSLQDGISTALQQSKKVVCFVTDGGTESEQWENEFLTDDSIRSDLESQSVILRLSAGSEEAGYLEALFPVPKKPTIVVIQNGQLKEYIAGGTSKEEFIRRLSKANESSSRPSQPSSSSVPTPTPVANPAPQNTTTQLSHNDNSLYADVQPAATPASSSSPPPAPSEEEKRLSAEKKGKARAAAGTQPPTAAEQAHANEVKLRKHHVNEERKRILKRIEDDKRARRERDAAERRARTLLGAADLTTPASPDAAIALTHQRPMPPRTGAGAGAHCNLQVRLLDGATLRARFPASGTPAADVRAWVDAARTDGDAPYTFRVVLAPQPSRALAAREEAESLASLGLAPSATLVLVPAAHSVAYARAGGVLAPVLGVVSSLCGAVMASIGGLFALFFGGGGGGGGGGGERQPGARRDDVPMENLRSRRGDAQLYNGNSLNFEPRKEDEDEDTR
ncbi:hypothetical protein GGS24DRAFT_511665 [Hypoxylon argillaceum]|nr:hypothetical protein GGS24DRAFT_511665 [Hypoxylon argillaceum]